MKGSWNQKLCAVATVSMLLSSAPVGVLAQENARITQSDPEEVYVDIIGDGQRTTLFNENWKFHRGDINDAQNKDYNDSTWETVNLPHDYSIDQDFTTSGEAESGFLPGGVGWYRKTFVVPKKYQEKQLMIEFDGAYMNAEVYLNGTKLGEHPYGYTAFAFDLTEGLICDGETENVLVVKTNNKIPSSRWYSGSGIYRDVKLTVTDKVHVGYNGTKIIAKDLENTKDNNVKVDVTATIDNDSDTNKTITVKNTLLDAQGNAAGSTVTNEVELAAKSTKDVKQEVSVIAPKLWSTEDTNLYTMKTEIVADNKVLDTYETEYGFRYFDFDNNTGFSLNGEKIKLEYDTDFRYVKVNNNYYDFNDFNNAVLLQSTYIYDKNQPITIVEALTNFSKIDIDNINDLKSNKISVKNNNSLAPKAEYGKFYFVGSRKKSMLVSLASSAISTIIAFLVTGALGLSVTKANVVSFISGVLSSEGVNYFTSDVYYKVYQAILNAHNTTREKRILGVFQPFKAQVVWDDAHPYYRTFETQRPNS